MNKTPFIPPKNSNPQEFEKSKSFEKYVQPVLDNEKKQKHLKHLEWWHNNWIAIITLLVSVLTLVATILFGILSMLD